MPEAEPGGGGLFDPIRRVGNSVLGLLHTRLSLFAIELQEEKLRAVNLLLWLCVALTCGVAGILIAFGALAFFVWQRAGYAGVSALAAAALAAAAVMIWLLRRRIQQGPAPFASTVSEFGKDLECLRPRD